MVFSFSGLAGIETSLPGRFDRPCADLGRENAPAALNSF
jgi:hypothetical protein